MTGERIGGFLVLQDEDGLRHAVRLGAILAFSEGTDGEDVTVLQISGNRRIVVWRSFDEVSGWIGGGASLPTR